MGQPGSRGMALKVSTIFEGSTVPLSLTTYIVVTLMIRRNVVRLIKKPLTGKLSYFC